MQYRIYEKGKLLDERGQLMDHGYATRELKDYNRSDAHCASLIRESDYFLASGDDFAVGLEVKSGILGTAVEVSFVDFHVPMHRSKRAHYAKRLWLPVSLGKGEYELKGRGMSVRVSASEQEMIEEYEEQAEPEPVIPLLRRGYEYFESTGLIPYFSGSDLVNRDVRVGKSIYPLLPYASHEKERQEPILGEAEQGKKPNDAEDGANVLKDAEIKKRKVRKRERSIHMSVSRFDGENDFECDLRFFGKVTDGAVLVTAFKNPRHFIYSQKSGGMQASGCIRFGQGELLLDESEGVGFCGWVRGAYLHKARGLWAFACEPEERGGVGFNLTSCGKAHKVNENMIFYGGKGSKLESVQFTIPQTKRLGKPFYMGKWSISTLDDRVSLSFRPVIDKKRGNRHQIFGLYNGTIILDDGRLREVVNLIGFIGVNL